ncbi:MAG: hypothetical protein ACJAS9_003228 [Polaribacter sp.]|jgi:hypothetical protein
MLISDKKNFLYFHLYKVAGTSIRNALIPYCSKSQVVAQNANYIASILGGSFNSNPLHQFHPDLKKVRDHLGDKFYSYYRFTFVREPLDWQKSIYFFTKKNPRHHQHKIVKDMTFEEYLRWRINTDLKLQSDLLIDGNELLVNDTYKFEDIQNEFKKLSDKLGIFSSLKHKNIAGAGKKIEISPQLKTEFIDIFRKDYETFGYELI